MNGSKAGISHDRQAVSPNRRRFSEEFKREAVRLVCEEKHTFKAAAKAVGVSEKSLRDWHKKWAPPPEPPCVGRSKAAVPTANGSCTTRTAAASTPATPTRRPCERWASPREWDCPPSRCQRGQIHVFGLRVEGDGASTGRKTDQSPVNGYTNTKPTTPRP